MSKSLSSIDITTDTFNGLYGKVNNIVTCIGTEVVTANSAVGGAMTTGNGFVSGIFGANTIPVSTLVAGNVTSNVGTINVISNTSFLGPQLNISSNVYASGANITLVPTTFTVIGNTSLAVNTTYTSFKYVTNSSIISFTSNANLWTLNSNLAVQNAATFANIVTITGLFTLNANLNTTGTVNAVHLVSTTDLAIGSNVTVNTSVVSVGNSTVNTQANSSQITVVNIVSNTETTTSLTVGNSSVNTVANSTQITVTKLLATQWIEVNANVILSNTGWYVGNTTVASVANSVQINTGVFAANINMIVGANVLLTNTGITIGNSSVFTVANSSTVNTNIVNLGAALNVGSSLIVNTSTVFLGNSTVNSVINSSSIYTSGLLTVAGNAAVTGNLTLSGAVHTVSGNANFDSGVLFVDSLNNRIGVNNTAPTKALTVTGDMLGSANQTFGTNTQNRATFLGNANVAGTLRVEGDLSVGGNLVSTGTSQGDLIPGTDGYALGNTTNRWVLLADSGDVTGDFTIHGNTNFGVANGTTLNITNVNVTNNNIGSVASEQGASYTSTNTTLQVVDTFAWGSYRSAKYLVSIKNNSANQFQISEFLVVHDGGTVYLTEYGTVSSNGSMGFFDAVYDVGGSIQIKYQPVAANTTLKIHKTLLVL